MGNKETKSIDDKCTGRHLVIPLATTLLLMPMFMSHPNPGSNSDLDTSLIRDLDRDVDTFLIKGVETDLDSNKIKYDGDKLY